jgi:hypothetical protein
MYGVGCKKGLMEGFAASTPEEDEPVVVVNGYFARLSLKEVRAYAYAYNTVSVCICI